MRFVLVAAIASAVSSSNAFAEEDFVIVPEQEDVIAYDDLAEDEEDVGAEIISDENVTESDEVMSVINDLLAELESQGEVSVLDDDAENESILDLSNTMMHEIESVFAQDGSLSDKFQDSPREDAIIEMGDGQKLTLKALIEFARKPSTQDALKVMFAGFKKSVVGMMTPETVEDIPRLLDVVPLIFVAAIVSSNPNLQAHLFQSGLPHYLLYDAMKSTLSNGGLIPKMSHSIDENKKKYLIGIMSVIASFLALGAPSKSMGGNLHFAQLFTGLFEFVKWWVQQKLQDMKIHGKNAF